MSPEKLYLSSALVVLQLSQDGPLLHKSVMFL